VLEKFDLLEADYIDTGKVRYIVHPYHLGSPETALAAEAAWCAQDREKFFEYQHALFERQADIAAEPAWFVGLAEELGLDVEAFDECLSSGRHRADVEAARQAAVSRGVDSTPTFFVNDQKLIGNRPYPEFQQIIEQELALAQ
jgi:protein-disulfide isomerase